MHLPNFGDAGDAACAAYSDAGISARCQAEYDRPGATLSGAVPWLRGVLAP